MDKKLIMSLYKNKTIVFPSPFEDGEISLVRTGVINDDNNSFFHSILTSYSDEYYNMDDKERINFLVKLKESIFTRKNFELNKTNYKLVKNKIYNVFSSIYSFISLKKDFELETKLNKKIITKIKNNKLYDLFEELLPFDKIKDILKKDESNLKIYIKNIKVEIEHYLNTFNILSHVESKKSEFIKQNILNIVSTIMDEVLNFYYCSYFKNISNNLDYETVKLISERLKINIYSIDSKTKLPFLIDQYKNFEHNQSIVIVKIENNFESIGLLLKRNRIQRIFDSNHTLIKKINTYLLNPKEEEFKSDKNEEEETEKEEDREKEEDSDKEEESENEEESEKDEEKSEKDEESDVEEHS